MYSNMLSFLPTIKFWRNASVMWGTIIGFAVYIVILSLVPIFGEISAAATDTSSDGTASTEVNRIIC
jgi:hypothetical protein